MECEGRRVVRGLSRESDGHGLGWSGCRVVKNEGEGGSHELAVFEVVDDGERWHRA